MGKNSFLDVEYSDKDRLIKQYLVNDYYIDKQYKDGVVIKSKFWTTGKIIAAVLSIFV